MTVEHSPQDWLRMKLHHFDCLSDNVAFSRLNEGGVSLDLSNVSIFGQQMEGVVNYTEGKVL